jgi:hypothetical protein
MSREVVDVGQVKRPTHVVMVDADNPLAEVRGEFFWREDHERVVASVRDDAYRAGYADGVAAASAQRWPGIIRVRIASRRHLVFRALMLFIVVAYLATLIGGLLR